MKTLMTSKLTRRCLILAVMILGLVYVASSDRYAKPVMAAQCCEGCPGAGDPTNAVLGCVGGGSLSLECQTQCTLNHVAECEACVEACANDVYNCYSHCVYCGSNTGPYGECSSNSDCPYGYICAADNTCTPY